MPTDTTIDTRCEYCGEPLAGDPQRVYRAIGGQLVTTNVADHISFLVHGRCADHGSARPTEWMRWKGATPAEVSEVAETLGKPKRRYVQMDGWVNVEPGDPIIVPDAEGDALTGAFQYERRRTDIPVRAYITPNVAPADAARLLRKMADWVERGNGEILKDPQWDASL